MRFGIILIFSATTLMLSSCTTFDFSRQVSQQGNLLPQPKLNQLKVGMTKNDVSIILGTSLLDTMFNQDRWDYAYTWHQSGKQDIQKRVVIFFKNDRVVRIEKGA